MKKLLLIVCVCLGMEANAQVNVGQKVPDVSFNSLLNVSKTNVSLSALEGKVILLDFWASWCAPCIKAMPHLEELQQAYKDNLQVITLTSENKERIARFLQNRPSTLWFASDSTTAELAALFPYKIIPHSVLIDGKGIVRAITEPSHISPEVINKVLAGEEINLPLKEDRIFTDPATLMEQYFSASPQLAQRFVLQPQLQGMPSMMQYYKHNEHFENRRLTFVNVPLAVMYNIAYGDISSKRTVNLLAEKEKKGLMGMYCLDIIVPKGKEAQLRQYLAKGLKESFEIKANLEKQTKQVLVLQVADKTKIKHLRPSTIKDGDFSASGDSYNGKGVSIGKIAQYLENFGIVDMPVVDETRVAGIYDISFSFEPENKNSLKEALQKLGLELTEAQREVEILVLR